MTVKATDPTLTDATEVTEMCRHCLMCRHVCPVGNLTRMETLTPHGWAQLVALERRGLSNWTPETVDALYKCADCGNCQTHCVYSNPLPDGIAAARAQVAADGIAPAIVYELAEILKKWENPFVPSLPERAQGQGEVALFVGDEAHHIKPESLSAALTLMRAVGVEPVLIGVGRGNGFLASSLGLPEIARDLASATLAELEASGARRLLLLSPGDYYTMTSLYPERLGLQVPDSVEVLEVVPFLAEQFERGALRLRDEVSTSSVAYVDPTHSVRVPERAAAPRRLLEAVFGAPPRELFWRGERAYPCGDLALQFTQPQLADALTQSRLSDAVAVGADIVVTDAAGSLAHLERHADAAGPRVLGLYELLADHLVT